MAIHPRRAQAEAEAAAWLDLHSDWATGLPAEIRDTSVRGQLFHDCLGDGWDTLWWQSTASDHAAPTARTTSTTPRCVIDSDYDQSLPTIERRRVLTGRLGDYGVEPSTPARIVSRAGTEQLRDVTVVLGQRVPGDMTYDRRTDSRRRAGVTQSFPDVDRLGVDESWIRQLAVDELVSWLRVAAGCTDLEIEALQRRAAGQAQPSRSDRETLHRAQRRARAAFAS